MLVAIAIISALGAGLGIVWVVSSPKMQPDRAAEFCWNEFATRLGLDYDAGGILRGPQISGTLSGMSLRMETYHQQGDGSKLLFTRLVIDAGDALPNGFDSQSKATAADRQAKRLLAEATRSHINNLIKKIGATITLGKVRLIRPGSVWSPDVMIKTVKHIIDTCEFLCLDPEDVAGRLLFASRAATIGEKMRAEFKRVLMEDFPGSTESNSAAAELIDDADPRTRLRAAKSLGVKGIPTLLKVGLDPAMTREVRDEAVTQLIQLDNPDRVAPGIRQLLTSTHAEVFRIALTVVRRTRYSPAAPTLAELAGDSQMPGAKVATITEVIGEMGDGNSQPLLINLLNHDFLLVRRRAAAALGRLGNATALPALEMVMKGQNVNRRLKDLCATAIKSIRVRSGIGEEEVEAEAS